MVFRGAGAALLLLAGAAYRLETPEEDLADFKSKKQFWPEKDENILNRITNVVYQPGPGVGALLPDLVPQNDEKVLGYKFKIVQLFHGKYNWFITGMRVRRTVFADGLDVTLEKPIHVAEMKWNDKGKHKMFVITAAKSKQELLRVRQEAKGLHLFRILPPNSTNPADTLYQFKTVDHALYSGSRERFHRWEVFRGDQTEEKYVDVSCHDKDCQFEKLVGEQKTMGITQQTDTDHKVTAVEMEFKPTSVEVMFDQDSALMLTIASTMVHKYKAIKGGVFG